MDAKYDECHAHAVDNVEINLTRSTERLNETGKAVAKKDGDAVMLANDSQADYADLAADKTPHLSKDVTSDSIATKAMKAEIK